MTNKYLSPAAITWQTNGVPVSDQFGDIYFSNHDGLLEARHVYLQGNHLLQRFIDHQDPVFTVAETGFGTGLSFLALWQLFKQFRIDMPETRLKKLHFISFEKYPLTPKDLLLSHQLWPELISLSTQLIQHWPAPVTGKHSLLLDQGQVLLDLRLGDINQQINPLLEQNSQSIQAWFLDGFAPAKNPDIWHQTLLDNIFKLTASTGTLATFTAAGTVRRGLQHAGFLVTKQRGFAHKLDMLTAIKPAIDLT